MATRHVALLRGINVGGKNKLPMKDLVLDLRACRFKGMVWRHGTVRYPQRWSMGSMAP